MSQMDKEFHTFAAPDRRVRWYRRWWGVAGLIFFALFGTFSVASAIYFFSVVRQIQSGQIAIDDIFGSARAPGSMAYGIHRPILGNQDAPVTMVVFMDFECAVCRDAARSIIALLQDPYYGERARFIIRHFPQAEINPNAVKAALAGECAHQQGKFLEVFRILFDIQSSLNDATIKQAVVGSGVDIKAFNECFEGALALAPVEQDVSDALALDLKTVPTFLISDKIIEGAPTVDDLKRAIDLLLIAE